MAERSRHLDRRTFLGAASAGAAALFALRAKAEPGGPPDLPPLYPTQNPELVREMVAVSHGNAARVRELLAKRPTLARAAWDWGWGDWETALGAASHMGNREIAELLLAHGARPTIFSAAMLGQLEVVRAFITASPGIQATKGPHGITLLNHARAGGAAAKPVLDYLASLGGADPQPKLAPLSDEERGKLVGSYRFGPGERDLFDVSVEQGRFQIGRRGGTPRGLAHLGDLEFFPAGAEPVSIRFQLTEGVVDGLEVQDADLVLKARRLAAPGG